MDLIVLGSGTGVPLADRASPALVVTSLCRPALFDMGPGTLRQLSRMGIRHERLGQIFLTHFHPDHAADLVHFLFATRNPAVLGERAPFTIVAPRGFRDFLKGLESAYGHWIQLPDKVMTIDELSTHEDDQRAFQGFQILSRPTPHASRSLAYRVVASSGSSFVYTGDTAFSPELADFADGCDLLVTEASFPEGREVEGHLTPAEAGRMASLARARKLVVIHFYPDVLRTDIASECRKAFGGEIVLGSDFLHLKA